MTGARGRLIVTLGRIVHYRLTAGDADAIMRRRTDGEVIREMLAAGTWPRGAQAHIGCLVAAGQIVPLIVTAVEGRTISGQAMLDGSDSLWVQRVEEGADHGQWTWPERV